MTTTSRERLAVHIRWMIRRDMPQVLAIEHASFAAPWGDSDFLRMLWQRQVTGLVAEPIRAIEDGTVCGFMVHERLQGRYLVHNLAVCPVYRRRGVGRALLARLVGRLSPLGRTRIEAIIREGNVGAHLFLRACGLRATGVIRGHYEDTGEDAYRFVYQFGGTGGESTTTNGSNPCPNSV